MSVKEELIATALTAADELDRVYENAPVEQNSNDLREACARAMVQPDMGEVKNLVSAACNLMFDAGKLLGRRDAGADREVEDARSARTALLDAVREIVAERDELIAAHAGATKKMARDERQLFESWIVRECGPGETKRWLNTEAYENMRVNDYRTGWAACLGLMSAASNPVSAAEVSMPEPDCVTFSRTVEGFGVRVDAMRMDSAIRYGDAREAAGYARGLAENAKDAERYRWLRDKSVPPHNFYLSVPVEFADVRYTSDQVDAAIDAALRGEVKP